LAVRVAYDLVLTPLSNEIVSQNNYCAVQQFLKQAADQKSHTSLAARGSRDIHAEIQFHD